MRGDFFGLVARNSKRLPVLGRARLRVLAVALHTKMELGRAAGALNPKVKAQMLEPKDSCPGRSCSCVATRRSRESPCCNHVS